MSADVIVVKGDEPAVLFKWTGNASGVVIPGVRAGDINQYHWAAMSPHQRTRVERNAAHNDGAYKKVETPPVLADDDKPAKKGQ